MTSLGGGKYPPGGVWLRGEVFTPQCRGGATIVFFFVHPKKNTPPGGGATKVFFHKKKVTFMLFKGI